MRLIFFGLVAWVVVVFSMALLVRLSNNEARRSKEPAKIEYRYFGDKSRPATWLRKYTVPPSYHVWDDEFGRYVEVSKEKYDAAPVEDTK